MLGIGGKFAASKGMVRVPNLEGLSSSQAHEALQSSGLKVGTISSSSTGTQSLNGKAFGQSIASNTLVDYETVVAFQVYSYVAPPAPSGPTISNDTGCVYTKQVNYGVVCTPYVAPNEPYAGYGYATWEDQSYGIRTWSDGRVEEYNCGAPTGGNQGNVISGYTECGYVPQTQPVCNITPGCTDWYTSSCSGGQYYKTRRCWDSCGKETRTTNYFDCCTAGLVSCTAWSGGQGGQSRVCTYRRSDCSTYTVTETRCAVQTSTTCGSCVYAGYTIGSYKSCTTTTVDSSCNITRTTKSVKC